MRFNSKPWLATLFGVAIVSNLIGFGVVGTVVAQSVGAATPAATTTAK